MEPKFNFGDKVRHVVLGIEGIVMAYTHYSTGCTHYGVQEQEMNSDGEPKDWKWWDENRIELVKRDVVQLNTYQKEGKRRSGPAPNAPHG